MHRSSRRRPFGVCFVFLIAACVPGVIAQTATPVPTPSPTPGPTVQPSFEEDVIVSATKVDQENIDIPNSVSVISGEELRRAGTRRSPTRCRTSSASTPGTAPTTARAFRTSACTASRSSTP